MLISSGFPPLPLAGLGFDPSMLFGSVLGAGASIFKTIEDTKTAGKALSIEEQKVAEQKKQDARDFALQQAALAVTPSINKRRDEIMGLSVIVGVSVVLSAIFFISAVKAKKS